MNKLVSLLTLTVLSGALYSIGAVELPRRTVGLNGGYSTRGESGVAGVFFKYRFSRHFALSPSVDYVFKHHKLDAYSFNINTTYPIALGNAPVNFYPLAGVNFSSWNRRATPDAGDDVTSRKTEFGLNVGAGFEAAVTKTLTLSIEGYYNWIKTYDGAYIKASIGYSF